MRHEICAIAATAVVAFLFACGGEKTATDKGAQPAPKGVEPTPATTAKGPSPAASEALSYEQTLGELDTQLRGMRSLVTKQPKSWLQKERVAGLLIQRAQLTGNYDNYVEAQKLMESAFELAPPGTGPLLTRAGLNFALHRLAAVEPDLAAAEKAIVVKKSKTARIAGLRAEVHMHSGRYPEALHGYRTSHDLKGTHESAFRLARYYWVTGDFKSAEEWLEKAETYISGKSEYLRAWLHLQRGLMDLDRNRLDEAMAHYKDGAALFSGWWLLEEHMAEIDTLQGRTDKAEKSYRDLIERTGDPEFMEALSDLLGERAEASADQAAKAKDQAEAKELYKRARAAHLARLELLPEASWGHGLGHFLGSDDPADAAKALELAIANHETRPGSEAKVWLAQAHAKSGQLDKALPVIETVLGSPYRTAEMHATAALLLRAAGQAARADEQEKLAKAIHSEALAELSWLSAALSGSATRKAK